MIRQVDNVNDAVLLATELRNAGESDWFRGQIQNWPLVSSYCRLAEDQRENLLQKFARFEQWIKFTPGLEPIAASTDMTLAVAQHYGIPTNFVDFTTEPTVAGFFASHGMPSSNRLSCVICLDTKDLAEFWEQLKPVRTGGLAPEFVQLTVPNLWRLEAQRGVFLFCPFPNFEDMYDLDRIVFPFTVPISDPPESLIYPTRKSQLETLLDQYFMNETLIEGTRAAHARNISIHRIPSRPEKCDRNLVPNGPPPCPKSWDASALMSWRQIVPEVFSEKLTSDRCELTVSRKDDPVTRIVRVSRQVQAHLTHAPDARRSLLSWALSLDDFIIPPYEAEEISQSLQQLWDGIRLLPYSGEQIADGMGCCVTLATEWLSQRTSGHDDWEHICRRVFSDAIEVEFGSDDGSYSRAFVPESALLAAVRADIGKFLNPAYADQVVGNMVGLLQAIWAPNRLFEFDRLSHLISTRIAPAQVLMREGSAIFYSAARLDSFGLP